MNLHRLLLLPFLLSACTSATDSQPSTAVREAPVAPSAQVTPDAGRVAPAPTDPVAPPSSTWRSVPKEQGGFSVVLDGLCSKLGVAPVGEDWIVHYGGLPLSAYSTGERSGLSSFIALHDSTFVSIGAPTIEAPTGIAGTSRDSFWLADSTGTRSSSGAVLHRYRNGAWTQYPKDRVDLHPWVDGSVIGQGGLAVTTGELWVEGSDFKPPVRLTRGLELGVALAAFPSGDVMVAGVQESDTKLVARHWSKAKGFRQFQLTMIDRPYVRLVETAPDEIYAVGDRVVARWDGAKWRLLGKATQSEITQVRRAGPDDLWIALASGALERTGAQGFVREPTPEPIVDLDGFSFGAPWLVGRSGKLYTRNGAGWEARPLPAPAFSAGASMKAKSVRVGAKDDVSVIAQYWESGLGWKERELHTALVRSKPTKEVLRCNEPDPENNNLHIGQGFQSWPPFADESCQTPFVVLARRSNALGRKPSDWPKLRAAFKGHSELGPLTLVEFVSGDRTFVGVKAQSFDSAKQMVKLALAKERLRPEIVCGAPMSVERSLALDLDTGAVR